MYQNKFSCLKAKSSSDDILVFFVPCQRCEEANAHEKYYRSLVKRIWTSFDEFIEYGFQMFYIVQFSKAIWNTESSCSCICFFKENICKHIIAVGMKENIIDCSDETNPTQINKHKRAAGRAQKAKRALEMQ